MLIIAERINASRKYIAQAISTADAAFIQNEVKAQALADADYIDVNAGSFVGEEEKYLRWLIEIAQQVTELPLCIDSPDPKVIKAVLPLTRSAPPMINSITLEPARLEGTLPLIKEYKAKVIALCQSEDSMAETTESKVMIAGQLVKRVTDAGVPISDLYIDPLIYPLSTNPESALASLKAIEMIMKEFPGVHTVCGLTNVSYGLPNRKLINRTFLVSAINHGLDAAILDPTDKQLYGSLKAAIAIIGKDDFCMDYINSHREKRLE
jgi:cobalamin-dependent methionine synthase I